MSTAHESSLIPVRAQLPVDKDTSFLAHYDVNLSDNLRGNKGRALNTSLRLNGSSARAQISSGTYFNSMGFTIELYVFLHRNISNQRIFSFASTAGGLDLISLYTNSTTRALCLNVSHTIASGQVTFVTSNADALELRRWYHVAVVYENSRYTLYVDGKNVGFKDGTAPTDVTRNFCFLGHQDANSSMYPMDISYSMLRVWDVPKRIATCFHGAPYIPPTYQSTTGTPGLLIFIPFRPQEVTNNIVRGYGSTLASATLMGAKVLWNDSGPGCATLRLTPDAGQKNAGRFMGGVALEKPTENLAETYKTTYTTAGTLYAGTIDKSILDTENSTAYVRSDAGADFSIVMVESISLQGNVKHAASICVNAVQLRSITAQRMGILKLFFYDSQNMLMLDDVATVHEHNFGDAYTPYDSVGLSCQIFPGGSVYDTNGFRRFWVIFTPPMNAVYCRIEFAFANYGNASGELYLKELQFEANAYPTSYTKSYRGVTHGLEYDADCLDHKEGTISFWYKPSIGWQDTDTLSENAKTEYLFHWGNVFGTTPYLAISRVRSTSKYFNVNGSTTMQYIFNEALQGKEEVHIAVTWSTVLNQSCLYINGVKVREINANIAANRPAGGYFYVGGPCRTYAPSIQSTANGIIDEFRIDLVARTSEEIEAWYLTQTPFSPKGLDRW